MGKILSVAVPSYNVEKYLENDCLNVLDFSLNKLSKYL